MKMRKFGAVCTALLLALLLALPGYASGGAAEEAPLPEASLPEELPPAAEDLPLEEAPPLAELPPVEEETPPAGEETPPTEEETPPAGEETPPAEGETPPAEGETPPAEEETPPTEEEMPPAEGETPPAEGETPPTEEETPPAGGEAALPPAAIQPDPLPDVLSQPVISVDAPVSARVVINPYRMKVRVGDTESDSSVAGGNEVLRNYSAFPVRVEASAVGTPSPGSGAVFVSEPPAGETAERAVFMYLEFQSVWSEYDQPAWSGAFQDMESQILVNGPGKAGILTLAPGTEGAPGYGMFRLFGETSSPPAAQWTAADTVDVTVAFSFTPAEGAGGIAPALWEEPPVSGPVPAEPEAAEPEIPEAAEPSAPEIAEPEVPDSETPDPELPEPEAVEPAAPEEGAAEVPEASENGAAG